MIALRQDRLHGAVAAALGEIAPGLTEARLGCWRVDCGENLRLTATLDDEWFQLRAPFAAAHLHGEAVPRCAWEALLRNGLLPGGAKLVTDPDHSVIHAALELPLDLDATPPAEIAGDALGNTLTAKINRAVDDLKQAARPHLNCNNRAARCHSTAEAAELPALCAAAGWPSAPRNEGRIAVQLEVPHGYAQAIVAWDDGLRATVDLYRTEHSLSPSSRQAIAVMLLQLGGTARAVRPAVHSESGRDLLVLQAYLGPHPSARELDRILSGLSVAAGMCQREIGLLSDEKISSRYLSARGWSAIGGVPASSPVRFT